MSIYDLEEKKPAITPYRHPPAEVRFDDEAQPYDVMAGSPGYAVPVDWDLLEEMLLTGKFQTKVEVGQYCRRVYTLIYDKDDRATHWTKATWRRIRDGLVPEALEAYMALPQQFYTGRQVAEGSHTGMHLLQAGKCKNGHKIKSVEDLASIGPDSNGKPRLGCIHCGRERSRRARQNKKGK